MPHNIYHHFLELYKAEYGVSGASAWREASDELKERFRCDEAALSEFEGPGCQPKPKKCPSTPKKSACGPTACSPKKATPKRAKKSCCVLEKPPVVGPTLADLLNAKKTICAEEKKKKTCAPRSYCKPGGACGVTCGVRQEGTKLYEIRKSLSGGPSYADIPEPPASLGRQTLDIPRPPTLSRTSGAAARPQNIYGQAPPPDPRSSYTIPPPPAGRTTTAKRSPEIPARAIEAYRALADSGGRDPVVAEFIRAMRLRPYEQILGYVMRYAANTPRDEAQRFTAQEAMKYLNDVFALNMYPPLPTTAKASSSSARRAYITPPALAASIDRQRAIETVAKNKTAQEAMWNLECIKAAGKSRDPSAFGALFLVKLSQEYPDIYTAIRNTIDLEGCSDKTMDLEQAIGAFNMQLTAAGLQPIPMHEGAQQRASSGSRTSAKPQEVVELAKAVTRLESAGLTDVVRQFEATQPGPAAQVTNLVRAVQTDLEKNKGRASQQSQEVLAAAVDASTPQQLEQAIGVVERASQGRPVTVVEQGTWIQESLPLFEKSLRRQFGGQK